MGRSCTVFKSRGHLRSEDVVSFVICISACADVKAHWNLHPGPYLRSYPCPYLGPWPGNICTSSGPFAWALIKRRLQLWQAIAHPHCHCERPGQMGTAPQHQPLGWTAVTRRLVGNGGRGPGGRQRPATADVRVVHHCARWSGRARWHRGGTIGDPPCRKSSPYVDPAVTSAGLRSAPGIMRGVGSGGRGSGGRQRQGAMRILGLYERSAAADGVPRPRRRGARWARRPRTRRCSAPPRPRRRGALWCGRGGPPPLHRASAWP